jgi:hypothetical protein
MPKPTIALDETHRAVADGCLSMTVAAVEELGRQGQTVNGFMRPLVVFQRWLSGKAADRELREAVADARGLRSALAGAVSTHESGLARVDASVRATVAWMIWRVGAFIAGQQDASVFYWCRMGLAEVQARYEGAPPFVAVAAAADEAAKPPAPEDAGELPGVGHLPPPRRPGDVE